MSKVESVRISVTLSTCVICKCQEGGRFHYGRPVGGEEEVPVYGGTCDNAARCVIRRAIRAVCGEIFPAWNSGLS